MYKLTLTDAQLSILLEALTLLIAVEANRARSLSIEDLGRAIQLREVLRGTRRTIGTPPTEINAATRDRPE